MQGTHQGITTDEVRRFWQENPLCAAAIPYERGTREYFQHHNFLREAIEPPDFANRIHEFDAFRGKKVLEVGCGNGYVLSKYAAQGAEVFGVDITDVAVELTKQRFAVNGLTGHFQTGDAENLPFDDDTFDCVCSMGVLHHVPNTERGFDELFRVLKPGGRVIVMLYHRHSVWYQCGMRLRSLIGGKSMQRLVNEVDGAGNPKGAVYTANEMRALLRRYDNVETFAGCITGDMVLPKFGSLVPNRILKPFERRWGWFLYGKGTKPYSR